MTNLQIKKELGRISQNERNVTKQLLLVLCEAEDKESYLEFGHPSLFAWLTKYYKYSAPAADRRIRAANLLRGVPFAKDSVRNGSLNLSTMARASSVIKSAQKAGAKITREQKAKALRAIENQSTNEAEKILQQFFPQGNSKVTKGKRRRMKNNLTRCPVDFNDAQLADLERLRELFSHKMPAATDSELLAYLLSAFLKEEDPLRAPAAELNISNAQTRRAVIQRSAGACEFRDEETGEVCGSRHQIEIDHIKPRALGGDDSAENLRVLCRGHNLIMAERAFGRKHMARYRRKREG